jgi:hypothetical protein
MLTIAETDVFTKQANALFTEAELDDLKLLLAVNPEAGDVIKGTGGLRKLRWKARQKGKRGGARVIYFYYNETIPVQLLLAYSKTEQEDLTPHQQQVLSALVERLKTEVRHGR